MLNIFKKNNKNNNRDNEMHKVTFYDYDEEKTFTVTTDRLAINNMVVNMNVSILSDEIVK